MLALRMLVLHMMVLHMLALRILEQLLELRIQGQRGLRKQELRGHHRPELHDRDHHTLGLHSRDHHKLGLPHKLRWCTLEQPLQVLNRLGQHMLELRKLERL